MSKFPATLRRILGERGITQNTLAAMTGCSKAAISQYLSGTSVPSAKRLQTIADALGICTEDLTADYASPAPSGARITTEAAARCLGKSPQFIRVGLQRGILPFGNAVPGTGTRWNYYISPALLRAYVGAEKFAEIFGT